MNNSIEVVNKFNFAQNIYSAAGLSSNVEGEYIVVRDADGELEAQYRDVDRFYIAACAFEHGYKVGIVSSVRTVFYVNGEEG